ncbi:MAG: exo-alpha-sialidase [Pirellulaceae bacterium]|nr:exo-alpha-sialidase [Pirellulaceae bacterium]
MVMKTRVALLAAILLGGVLLAIRDWRPNRDANPVERPIATGDSPGDSPLFREGFIQDEQPGLMAHVASIAPLDGGRMAAVWYAGTREGARDVAILFATHDGRRWSEPRALVDRRSCSRETSMAVKKVGNPVIFRDGDSRLWLVYSSVIAGGWSASSLNYKVSNDFGRSWTPSRKLLLSPMFNLTYNVKNGPMLLDDGSFVLPIYHEMAKKRSALLHVKPEGGEVSYQVQRITFRDEAIQPSLVSWGDGRLLATFRNMAKGRVLAATSEDGGRKWSDLTPLDLPNPDAGLDAIRIGPTTVLAALNDSPKDRSNLSLAVSDDRGASWRIARVLEQKPGMEYAYPSLAIDDRGLIHLVYTYERKAIKHVVFNEAWLRETLR